MELVLHVAGADVGLACAGVADYHDLIQLKILIHLILICIERSSRLLAHMLSTVTPDNLSLLVLYLARMISGRLLIDEGKIIK